MSFDSSRKKSTAPAQAAKRPASRAKAQRNLRTTAVRYLMLGGDIYTLQELLGHEDIATIKNYMHLNDALIQEQKRKFSPGDNMPFTSQPCGRKSRIEFREPVKRKPTTGRGIKPKSSE